MWRTFAARYGFLSHFAFIHPIAPLIKESPCENVGSAVKMQNAGIWNRARARARQIRRIVRLLMERALYGERNMGKHCVCVRARSRDTFHTFLWNRSRILSAFPHGRDKRVLACSPSKRIRIARTRAISPFNPSIWSKSSIRRSDRVSSGEAERSLPHGVGRRGGLRGYFSHFLAFYERSFGECDVRLVRRGRRGLLLKKRFRGAADKIIAGMEMIAPR